MNFEQQTTKRQEMHHKLDGMGARMNREAVRRGKEALEAGRPLAYDLGAWLTKQQACERLGGLSERTLDRMVERHEIERRDRPIPGRRPEPVHNPADIDRLTRVHNPTVIPTANAPVSTPSAGKGETVTELSIYPAIPAAALLTEYRRLLSAATPPTKLWLTMLEAWEHSGLTKTLLRRLVKSGALAGIKDRGMKVRRADLEILSAEVIMRGQKKLAAGGKANG